MKNFRKVLALILVVATLFSFVAMASAKTLEDYSDASEVQYKEAVDVLSALGVINGYDGAFHPNDPIDRDEMAKMVAVLRNASDFNADLYASANKFADAKGSWAEGYIAYCAQVGIVAGRNATTFDPDGKVTGVEVLKMLLCTLGYDAKEQGYVGTNWQVNVLRDAKKSDLLTGLADMDVYAAATRDQAAQMFLNALESNMVYGYLSESVVKLTGSVYEAFVLQEGEKKFFPWPSTPDAEYAGEYEMAYCNAILSPIALWKIYDNVDMIEELDCFGRPASVWYITNQHGVTVLEKAYADVPDMVFTEDVKLATELGGIYGTKGNPFQETNNKYDIEVYVNGKKYTGSETWTEISKLTGNGVLTEIFVQNQGGKKVVTVVVIETYIGKVGAVTKNPARIQLNNGDYIPNVIGAKKGDYVLYTKCAGDAHRVGEPGHHEDALQVYSYNLNGKGEYIHEIEVVEPIVDEVIHASKGKIDLLNNSSFQTNSEKYEYSATFAQTLYADEENFAGPYVPEREILERGDIAPKYNKYDIYVNEFGYVMWVEEHEDKYDYEVAYVVEDSHDASNFRVESGVSVRDLSFDLVDFNGRLNADVTAEANTWGWTSNVDDGRYPDGTKDGMDTGVLMRYFVNEYGEVEVYDDETTYGIIEGYAETADTDAYLVKGVAKIYGTDVLANAKTQYMVRSWNWSTGEYDYNVYTGYKNLPETLFGYKAVQDEKFGTSTVYATLQYLVSEEEDADPNIATHVFVDVAYAGTSQYFFITKAVSDDTETKLYPWLRGYTVFEVLMNGETAYIAISTENGDITGTKYPVPTISTNLMRAKIKVIEGATIYGTPIYMAVDPEPVRAWTELTTPENGLFTFSTVANAAAKEYKQISDDAVIHVIFPAFDADDYEFNYDTDFSEYRTFSGETRDEDFDEFFLWSDWDEANVKKIFTREQKVGDRTFGEVYEVVEMWIYIQKI